MITAEVFEATQAFIQDLSRVIPETAFDRMTRLLYSTDASIYQILPYGVAFPRDADQICGAVEIASKHRVPILARGGGSSLAGQAVGRALILDLSRYMDQVLQIDVDERSVRTQPGITLSRLNKALAPHGLMYGPDPASAERATMGGILGNNSTGAHSIVYGMTVDHVQEVDVVLADSSLVRLEELDAGAWEAHGRLPGREGGIYRAIPGILERYREAIACGYPQTFRHVAGYNLNQLAGVQRPNMAKLMVGSEGTLGVVSAIKFKLVPIPKAKRLAMVHFKSRRAALEAVPVLLESEPSAIEVLDKMLLDLTRGRVEYSRLLTFVEGQPEMILMVEYAGETSRDLERGIERMRNQLSRIHHRDPVIVVSDPIQQANVWYVRKVGLGILMSIPGDAKPIPFIEDAAVPVDHLADYVTTITHYALEVGAEDVAMYAHASAGCMHIRPLINLKTEAGLRQLRMIAEKSVELVVGYGGTTSGEHGEGLARGEFSERLFGSELVEAFREVKAVFDPEGILNPGKVVDTARMDDESILRFGTDYGVPHAPDKTILHFIRDGGFAPAVEMCNGAGVCRQLEQGVMCPSFQLTGDEAHSTRGRANALRAAMMGLLGQDGLTSQELYAVLDLCLSCSACKSECPSAVDMSKLKAEFLHQYYKRHGVPLRARFFANVGRLLTLAQPIAGVANRLMQGPGKWVLTQLGVHPARLLPTLVTQPFSQWVSQQASSSVGGGGKDLKEVVLFHDTFMEHQDTHIGRAAYRVLEAAGYTPIVLRDRVCCGRPAVSKGMLGDAQRLARHNLQLLAPYAVRGIPIIGCEPSCMSMLVDEYRDLVPGAEAEAVAAVTVMLDDFLVRIAESEGLMLEFDSHHRQVLFHGHCQQKANFGIAGSKRMLEGIPNCRVEVIESGCCGMAGSFGYEREHYELSLQLAEMALAPAIRSASEEAIICASGFSCREQIQHTTGRKALHPIEILAGALGFIDGEA